MSQLVSQRPKVAIIITAWNQLAVTVDCLASVTVLDYAPFEIFLIDNGSEPSLQPLLTAEFPYIRFVRNEHNLGFAGGYNTGLREALAHNFDLFFLLNNDTVLDRVCLDELVAALENSDGWGLVMPKIYYASDPTCIWSAGANYRPVLRELKDEWQGVVDTRADEERPRIIEFAPFCAVLLSRQLLETVGLLDEQFFLYYEDLDYCQRMRQAGYTLAMIPTAKVWHKVSVSTGGWHTPMERFLMAQSSGRYFRRHGQGWRMFFILPYRLASALRLTVVLSYKSEWRSLRAYWYGLWLGWRTGQANTPAPRWVRTQTQ